ncbi:hypothetical protein BH18GEM1_BH18GEM1_01400 [soil metagenome]
MIAHGLLRGAASLLIAAGIGSPAMAQAPRLIDPATEGFTYDLLESIALRGSMKTEELLTAKPWSSQDLAGFLAAVDSMQPTTRDPEVWQAGRLREEVELSAARAAGHAGVAGLRHLLTVEPRASSHASAGRYELDPLFLPIRRREESGNPAWAAGGEIHVGYAWLPGGFSAVLDLRGRTNTRNALDYRDPDGDGSLEVRSAYALWQDSRFLVTAGRLPVEWGSGPLGGVGLTATGPALDGFLARARWGVAQLTVLSAFLSDERANRLREPDGDTVESSEPPPPAAAPLVNRYFHAHRVDLRLGDRLTLGISEMAIVTGVRRRPDLQFLTGLVPYVVAQNSREEIDGGDINLGAGLQYRWRLPRRVLLYGEYFANEVFVDNDIGAVLEGLLGRRQNTQGFQQGVRWAAPFGWRSVDLEAEVARMEPFLYLHRGLNTNWRVGGVPLGAPLGPDNQRALVRLRHYRPAGGGVFRGTAEIAYRERGFLRITDNVDIQAAGGAPSIPSDPAEVMWLGTLAAEVWWPRAGGAGIRLKGGRVRTLDNVVGDSVEPIDLELYLSFGPAWDAAF